MKKKQIFVVISVQNQIKDSVEIASMRSCAILKTKNWLLFATRQVHEHCLRFPLTTSFDVFFQHTRSFVALGVAVGGCCVVSLHTVFFL